MSSESHLEKVTHESKTDFTCETSNMSVSSSFTESYSFLADASLSRDTVKSQRSEIQQVISEELMSEIQQPSESPKENLEIRGLSEQHFPEESVSDLERRSEYSSDSLPGSESRSNSSLTTDDFFNRSCETASTPRENPLLCSDHKENPSELRTDTASSNKSSLSSEESVLHRSRGKSSTSSDFDVRGFSLASYMLSEVRRGYMLEQNKKKLKERRKRVYTFIKTPWQLEMFLCFGTMICADVFLFLFTLLPIRALIALISLPFNICLKKWSRLQNGEWLESGQKIDVLKVLLILFSSLILRHFIDTSVIYHVVRAQDIMKLYVVYNMIDIADKLLASLGHDVLDALFWTATERRQKKREHMGVVPHILMALTYVSAHSLLIIVQAIVLNVAINSFSKALLTIMISNQFIEIKTSVFKRFERNNLFQLSVADARERFHIFIIVLFVGLRNLTQYNWHFSKAMGAFVPYVFWLVVSELVVDSFKHAFVVKFNDLKPEVYQTFRLHLAQNIVFSKDMVFTGHTDQAANKMGFSALPLAVVIIHVVSECVKIKGESGFILVGAVFLSLCSLKLFISILIYGKSCKYVNENEESKEKDIVEENDVKILNSNASFKPISNVQDLAS